MTAKRFGIIRIKKRTVPEWLTYFIIVFPLVMGFLIEFLGLPSFIKYIVDVAYVSAFLFLISKRQTLINKKILPFVMFTVVFLIYTVLIHMFHFQSPFYYLWGFRNNFRFFIAFILYSVFFEEDDLQNCLRIMDGLFWINAVVSVFQFVVLGYEQDHLGGIFGVAKGCNAFTLIFFSVVVSKSILAFMNRKENSLLCFAKCGISLLVSVMAELKVYFIIFPFILIVSAFITRFSIRKLFLMLVSAIMLVFASIIITTIFKDDDIISFEGLIETITATNYSTSEDLGRFFAIPTISRKILTKPWEKLFGLGLGNCDTSSFAICNTPFYMSHSYLHYEWFSSATMFLETGYVGLVGYLSFYVMCFVLARKRMKSRLSDELFCQVSMVVSLICVIMFFYNSALRTEAAYISFFALALPFSGGEKQPQQIVQSR